MARIITYKCHSWRHRAVYYEGHGFMRQHITMVSWPNCHTLQPLVVGGVIGDAAPSFNTEVGRLCLKCGSQRITL
jgi:hypothetical protein